ncbi:MAG: acyltransferase [Nanoarchaeota archaeon]
MITIHPTAIVESKSIGEGTKIWHHAHVRDGAKIGSNCIIGKNVYIDPDVVVGSNVKIQNNVCVYNAELEDDTQLGPGVIVTNDPYPRAFVWNDNRKGGRTYIKKGASVGANSTLIPGITIGEYAMIGASSVVTKDVPSHALVYGNPAKIMGYVCKCGKKMEKTEAMLCDDCNK